MAFVLCGLRQFPDGGEKERLLLQLASMQPSIVVFAGEPDELSDAVLRQKGVRVMRTPSPEAAAHLIHKLKTPLVFLCGKAGNGLDRTLETLLELEGELVPEGSLH